MQTCYLLKEEHLPDLYVKMGKDDVKKVFDTFTEVMGKRRHLEFAGIALKMTPLRKALFPVFITTTNLQECMLVLKVSLDEVNKLFDLVKDDERLIPCELHKKFYSH